MGSEMRTDQLEREMIRIGKVLINQIFVLLKTAQNYEEGHSAINAPVSNILKTVISNILKTVREIQRRNEEASLRVQGGYLILGELRLKPDAAGFDAFMFTMGEMNRYFIGCINFTSSVNAEEIGKLAYIFKNIEPIPVPQTFHKILGQMQKRNIIGIELEILTDEETLGGGDTSELKDSKARAKKVYLQTIHAVSEVMENAKMGQTLKLRKSKRVVQGMIDQLLAAETNLIGLTTIRSHDEYTYNHSVNVCILSLSIGEGGL
ncbi:MAG: Diguanylate phosphodiesterase [Deltaproteobacteria bacterium]|nr:Diguanylate phosphodiesterase [Deltaproteobacteria bacterium]